MKYYNIPIFVSHKGCPFDCVFCNQKRITGKIDDVDCNKIKKTIEEYLLTLPQNDDNNRIEVAFFGGSFTGIDFDTQGEFLSAAYEYVKQGKIYGIRLSTRPDYIDDKILNQLKKYGVTTIELGVQSLDEEVIASSNRGHSVEDVKKSVELIKAYGFSLGLQMMTGLPSDTDDKALSTCDKIIELRPDFVRIYPTLVIKDTRLCDMYYEGKYKPQTVDEAVNLCKKLLLKFEKEHIRVIRVSLQTTDEISPDASVVAGPFHAQFKELVEASIYYDKFCDALSRYDYINPVILVNDREISKAIGPKRTNIKKLTEKFNKNIQIKKNISIEKGQFEIINDVESEEQHCISND